MLFRSWLSSSKGKNKAQRPEETQPEAKAMTERLNDGVTPSVRELTPGRTSWLDFRDGGDTKSFDGAGGYSSSPSPAPNISTFGVSGSLASGGYGTVASGYHSSRKRDFSRLASPRLPPVGIHPALRSPSLETQTAFHRSFQQEESFFYSSPEQSPKEPVGLEQASLAAPPPTLRLPVMDRSKFSSPLGSQSSSNEVGQSSASSSFPTLKGRRSPVPPRLGRSLLAMEIPRELTPDITDSEINTSEQAIQTPRTTISYFLPRGNASDVGLNTTASRATNYPISSPMMADPFISSDPNTEQGEDFTALPQLPVLPTSATSAEEGNFGSEATGKTAAHKPTRFFSNIRGASSRFSRKASSTNDSSDQQPQEKSSEKPKEKGAFSLKAKFGSKTPKKEFLPPPDIDYAAINEDTPRKARQILGSIPIPPGTPGSVYSFSSLPGTPTRRPRTASGASGFLGRARHAFGRLDPNSGPPPAFSASSSRAPTIEQTSTAHKAQKHLEPAKSDFSRRKPGVLPGDSQTVGNRLRSQLGGGNYAGMSSPGLLESSSGPGFMHKSQGANIQRSVLGQAREYVMSANNESVMSLPSPHAYPMAETYKDKKLLDAERTQSLRFSDERTIPPLPSKEAAKARLKKKGSVMDVKVFGKSLRDALGRDQSSSTGNSPAEERLLGFKDGRISPTLTGGFARLDRPNIIHNDRIASLRGSIVKVNPEDAANRQGKLPELFDKPSNQSAQGNVCEIGEGAEMRPPSQVTCSASGVTSTLDIPFPRRIEQFFSDRRNAFARRPSEAERMRDSLVLAHRVSLQDMSPARSSFVTDAAMMESGIKNALGNLHPTMSEVTTGDPVKKSVMVDALGGDGDGMRSLRRPSSAIGLMAQTQSVPATASSSGHNVPKRNESSGETTSIDADYVEVRRSRCSWADYPHPLVDGSDFRVRCGNKVYGPKDFIASRHASYYARPLGVSPTVKNEDKEGDKNEAENDGGGEKNEKFGYRGEGKEGSLSLQSTVEDARDDEELPASKCRETLAEAEAAKTVLTNPIARVGSSGPPQVKKKPAANFSRPILRKTEKPKEDSGKVGEENGISSSSVDINKPLPACPSSESDGEAATPLSVASRRHAIYLPEPDSTPSNTGPDPFPSPPSTARPRPSSLSLPRARVTNRLEQSKLSSIREDPNEVSSADLIAKKKDPSHVSSIPSEIIASQSANSHTELDSSFSITEIASQDPNILHSSKAVNAQSSPEHKQSSPIRVLKNLSFSRRNKKGLRLDLSSLFHPNSPSRKTSILSSVETACSKEELKTKENTASKDTISYNSRASESTKTPIEELQASNDTVLKGEAPPKFSLPNNSSIKDFAYKGSSSKQSPATETTAMDHRPDIPHNYLQETLDAETPPRNRNGLSTVAGSTLVDTSSEHSSDSDWAAPGPEYYVHETLDPSTAAADPEAISPTGIDDPSTYQDSSSESKGSEDVADVAAALEAASPIGTDTAGPFTTNTGNKPRVPLSRIPLPIHPATPMGYSRFRAFGSHLNHMMNKIRAELRIMAELDFTQDSEVEQEEQDDENEEQNVENQPQVDGYQQEYVDMNEEQEGVVEANERHQSDEEDQQQLSDEERGERDQSDEEKSPHQECYAEEDSHQQNNEEGIPHQQIEGEVEQVQEHEEGFEQESDDERISHNHSEKDDEGEIHGDEETEEEGQTEEDGEVQDEEVQEETHQEKQQQILRDCVRRVEEHLNNLEFIIQHHLLNEVHDVVRYNTDQYHRIAQLQTIVTAHNNECKQIIEAVRAGSVAQAFELAHQTLSFDRPHTAALAATVADNFVDHLGLWGGLVLPVTPTMFRDAPDFLRADLLDSARNIQRYFNRLASGRPTGF